MPLTTEELDILIDALGDTFGDLASFEELAKLGLGQAADEFAPQAGISLRLLKLIEWADTNDQILVLFAYLKGQEAYQNVAKLRVAVDSLTRNLQSRQGIDLISPGDPFEAMFVYKDGRPFIDRGDFRDYLRELYSEVGNRILVVRGDRKTGKSHSRYLIDLLKIKLKLRCAVLDLSPDKPLAGVLIQHTPRGIVKEIDRQLKLPDLGPPQEQQNVDAQYNKVLLAWLVQKIQAVPEPTWIVFDGCSNPDLSQDTRDLLMQLPAIVAEYLQLTRLVLLDYGFDESFDALDVPPSEEDLSLLQKEKLLEYFSKLHEQRGLPCPQAELEAMVQGIQAKLPAQPERWMGVLMLETRKKAFEILKNTHHIP
jgi:hypothetical protein